MNKIKELYENNKREIFIMISILLIYTLVFKSFYPGIFTYDSHVQWNEVITGKLTNSHPFLSTYFILLLSIIHKTTTPILFFQIIISSLTITKIFKITRHTNMKLWLEIIVAILISSLQILFLYNITLWKDILYSYYLINYGIYLYEWRINNYKFDENKYIIMGLLLFLVFNYRLNGMVVSPILLIITLIIMIRKKINKKNVLYLIVSFVFLNLLLLIPKNYYLRKNPKDDNSVNIGTINTYIKWIYGGYLTDGIITNNEDLKYLNLLTDIDEWKKVYNPYLINDTNVLYMDYEYLLKTQNKFRKIFIDATLNNPTSFIKHYLKADALLINPLSKGYIYSYEFQGIPENNEIFINKIYRKLIIFTTSNKYISLFYKPANILYLCIIIVIILNKIEKTKKYWLSILPMLVNTLSLLPINIAQDLRYVYINYLTLIFIIIIAINKFIARRNKNESIINNSIIQ